MSNISWDSQNTSSLLENKKFLKSAIPRFWNVTRPEYDPSSTHAKTQRIFLYIKPATNVLLSSREHITLSGIFMKKRFSVLPTEQKLARLRTFLEEHKAKDVVELRLTHQNAFAEAMLVVTASSVRHAQSLAENVNIFCKQEKFEFFGSEGKEHGQWILMDLNDIVISIFQESTREVYKLESLWAELPTPEERTQEHTQEYI